MTPKEIEELKKEMGKVFVEEFKKVDFKKLIEDTCRGIMKEEGSYGKCIFLN